LATLRAPGNNAEADILISDDLPVKPWNSL